MKKRLISSILSVVFALSMLTACSDTQETTTESTESTETVTSETSTDTVKIGYIAANLSDTFQGVLLGHAEDYANEEGVELIAVDGQADVLKQIDHANSLISQGVDALVVIAADTSAMQPVTDAAANSNIPLIYANTNPYPDGNLPPNVYYVGSDETEAGVLQAKYILDNYQDATNIAILMGGLSYEATMKRTDGIKDYFSENGENINIVVEEPADWKRDLAMSVTENWLTAYDDIDAILANNDEMAIGAYNALVNSGKQDDIVVVGLDAIDDAVASVENGELSATVFQDSKGQARAAIKFAIEASTGVEHTEFIEWIPFVLIDENNIDIVK